jgi:hypothetical protein
MSIVKKFGYITIIELRPLKVERVLIKSLPEIDRSYLYRDVYSI